MPSCLKSTTDFLCSTSVARSGCSILEQGLERYLRYQAPHIRPPISSPPYQAPHIRPPISSPSCQTPHIKPPIASPLQYQDPISGHLFQYETADLPYQVPTYDIKPLVLDVQNEPPTYDIKLFELNLQYRKYQNRQPTISGHDQRYQAHRIRFSK